MALRVSISGYLVPFLGLGAELSDDYDERSSIVAWRAIVGTLATLLGYVLGFGVFLHGANGLLDRSAYVPFGWICAGAMFVTGALSCYASLRELPRMTVTIRSEHRLWGRLYREVREVFRNPSFRLLFAGVLFFFVGQGVALTLALDGSKYFWGFDANQIQAVALASVAGLAIGLPISFALIGRVEKRTVVVTGIIIIGLALSLPVLAQLLGLLPPGVFFRVGLQAVAGAVNGVMVCVISISFQSALADAVDEHEHLFATRREGLYFAALSFAGKAATGVGSLLSGMLLDAIHFPSQAIAAGGAVTIVPQVVRHLGLIAGPAAALVTVMSVFFFSRYKLNRAAHAVIRREIGR
jgi:GPH family glycoside/pentoside/hexuronide:cation symporter